MNVKFFFGNPEAEVVPLCPNPVPVELSTGYRSSAIAMIILNLCFAKVDQCETFRPKKLLDPGTACCT